MKKEVKRPSKKPTSKKKNEEAKEEHSVKVIPKQQDKKVTPKEPSFQQIRLRKDKDIALDFAAKVHRKFSDLVKATVLFGSQAKDTSTASSDIDVVIIVDDVSIKWDIELIAWYREELGKIIASNKYSKDLHITTVKLSTWWNDLMHGDPVVINILRYGESLIDLGGFFKPIKSLLLQGKIHSTPEAVYAALQRAPAHLARSKAAEASAVEGIYWTMVDSAQAALIMLGKLPASPEQLPLMLKTSFVDNKVLKMEYVDWFRHIFEIHKRISHGEISNVKGADIDVWQDRAEKFMLRMTEIIDILLEEKRK